MRGGEMTKLERIRHLYDVPAFFNGRVAVKYGGRERTGTIIGADTNLRLRVRLDCFSAEDVFLVDPGWVTYLDDESPVAGV